MTGRHADSQPSHRQASSHGPGIGVCEHEHLDADPGFGTRHVMGDTSRTRSPMGCGWPVSCIATLIAGRSAEVFADLDAWLGQSVAKATRRSNRAAVDRALPFPQRSLSGALPICCAARLSDGARRRRSGRLTEASSARGPVLHVLIPLRARGDRPLTSGRRQVESGKQPSNSTSASVVLHRASKACWPEQPFSKPFTGRWT